jgi:hypothetical protein
MDETEHVHLMEKKKEYTDWGLFNGGTLGNNVLIAQGHLLEQLDVEGGILVEERTEAIANEISL